MKGMFAVCYKLFSLGYYFWNIKTFAKLYSFILYAKKEYFIYVFFIQNFIFLKEKRKKVYLCNQNLSYAK